MFQKLFLGASVALFSLLVGCGGDGDDADGGALPPVKSSAEGFWQGKSTAGFDISLAVLDNGDTWGVYLNNGVIYRALAGSTRSGDGQLSGSGREWNILSGGSTALTYNGTYVAKDRLEVKVPGGGALSATYRSNYEVPASLQAAAGSYAGQGVSTNTRVQLMKVDISSSGAVYASSLGCTMSGTLNPRAGGKNILDLSVTFTGASCGLGNGVTVKGAAYYDSGTILALGRDGDRGFIFLGKK